MEEYIRVMTCFAGMIVAAISIVVFSRLRPSQTQKWIFTTVFALLIYHVSNFVKTHFTDAC